MRTLKIIILLSVTIGALSGCASRVLVKDCQKLDGTELFNCEYQHTIW